MNGKNENHRTRRFLPYSDKKRHDGDYLLVLGIARSGTSLLSSLLGGHPEINMLSECYDASVVRLIGKKYAGNKLCTHQIRYDSFSPVPERLALPEGVHAHRTLSRLMISDYEYLGTKFIIIIRNFSDVRRSMIKRAGTSYERAGRIIQQGLELITLLDSNQYCCSVGYESLCENPQQELEKICNFLDLEYDSRMLEGENFNWVYPEGKAGKL